MLVELGKELVQKSGKGSEIPAMSIQRKRFGVENLLRMFRGRIGVRRNPQVQKDKIRISFPADFPNPLSLLKAVKGFWVLLRRRFLCCRRSDFIDVATDLFRSTQFPRPSRSPRQRKCSRGFAIDTKSALEHLRGRYWQAIATTLASWVKGAVGFESKG